jgi:hypothetical protein
VKEYPMVANNSKALIHCQLAEKYVRDWCESKETKRDAKDEPYEVRERIPHQTLVVLGGFKKENDKNLSIVSQLEFYNLNSNTWTTVSYD